MLFTLELSDQQHAIASLLASVSGETVEDLLGRIVSSFLRNEVLRMTGDEFELLVGRVLERAGYDVEYRGGTGDEGIDLLAKRGSQSLGVQCKRYSRSQLIVPRQVRELLGSVAASSANKGVLVTTTRLTRAATDFCEKADIEVIDRDLLFRWLSQLMDIAPGKSHAPCQNSKCSYFTASLGEWTRVWICPECGNLNSLD